MTSREINALCALRGITQRKIARAISTKDERVSSSQVSQTINYLRENARLRKKIADYLGMPVDELFEPWIPPQAQRAASTIRA